MGDTKKCEGCGLVSDRAVYVRVQLLNGGLLLCSPCLTELNGKSPMLATANKRIVELEKAIGVCVPSIIRCYLKTEPGELDRDVAEKVLARVNAAMEYGKLFSEQPVERTRCSCSFSHPPHDWCDGNPNGEIQA